MLCQAIKGTADLLTFIEASQLTPALAGTLSHNHAACVKLQEVREINSLKNWPVSKGSFLKPLAIF